jgi:hypothetical protein
MAWFVCVWHIESGQPFIFTAGDRMALSAADVAAFITGSQFLQ